jgi:hypothetical protein
MNESNQSYLCVLCPLSTTIRTILPLPPSLRWTCHIHQSLPSHCSQKCLQPSTASIYYCLRSSPASSSKIKFATTTTRVLCDPRLLSFFVTLLLLLPIEDTLSLYYTKYKKYLLTTIKITKIIITTIEHGLPLLLLLLLQYYYQTTNTLEQYHLPCGHLQSINPSIPTTKQ